MFDKLGALGLLGILITLGGLGVVAYTAPVVAAGLALALLGLGLVVFGVVRNFLSSLGMGAMM